MREILLVNGPNLNMLGVREPAIYGTTTLADIEQMVTSAAAAKGITVHCFQSNCEGALIDFIQSGYGKADGIIINPGAYTHYSYALRDAIAGVAIPTVEIHISDIYAREDFRQISVIKPVCVAQISGQGIEGYLKALEILIDL